MTHALAFASFLLASPAALDGERIPVPGIEPEGTVEVWYSFALHSRSEDELLEGVAVEIGVCLRSDAAHRYDGYPVLHRTTSRAGGTVQGKVDLPGGWLEKEDVAVFARVVEAGYQRHVATRDLIENIRTPRLYLVQGFSVPGRVVDAADEPVRASVRWTEVVEQALSREWKTDGAGRFVADFPRAGVYTVAARLEGGVAGYLEHLSLAEGAEPLTLEVAGGGAPLAGRLVDPDGVGIGGMTLVALPQGRESFPSAAEALRIERAGGACGARVRTAPSGEFDFGRLVEGTYDVYASWLEWGSLFGQEVEHFGERIATAATGADSPTWVHGVHRIEVRVFDSRGEPLEVRRPKDERSPVEATKIVDGELQWWTARSGRLVGDARVLSAVPGSEVHVTWRKPGNPFAERRLNVSPRPFLHRVDFHLPPALPDASVTLRVLDPQGRDYHDGLNGYDTDPKVEIVSAGGYSLEDSIAAGTPGRSLFRDGLWTVDLPVGTYDVRTRSGLTLSCIVRSPAQRRPFVFAESRLEVVPGTEQRFVVHLQEGGYLDFVETGSDERTSRVLQEAFHTPEKPHTIDRDVAEQSLRACQVEMVHESGRTMTDPEFELYGSDGRVVWHGGMPWVVPGLRCRGLNALPPGRWTLTLRREGTVVMRRQLEVRAGEVTQVAW